MITTASAFFRAVALPNYTDCRNNASEVRLAMNFAISCVSLCDWVAAEYATILPDRVESQSRDYQNRLRKRSPDFALVCDIANAWKHKRISRADRQITLAEHVHVDGFRAGDPCGIPLTNIAADTRSGRIVLEPVFGRVIQLWSQELHDLEELAKLRGTRK